MSVAAIVIGRNEGARLIACLDALEEVAPVIYVDSGSTDGSVAAAQARGARVVTLDMQRPFTAARARNAGLAALPDATEFVQFLDGDCVMQKGWVKAARAHLAAHSDTAVVCGRRREMHPQASVYNALIDAEWDTPVGQTLACGGDALMRVDAVRSVGGYRDDLIAGEEPELAHLAAERGDDSPRRANHAVSAMVAAQHARGPCLCRRCRAARGRTRAALGGADAACLAVGGSLARVADTGLNACRPLGLADLSCAGGAPCAARRNRMGVLYRAGQIRGGVWRAGLLLAASARWAHQADRVQMIIAGAAPVQSAGAARRNILHNAGPCGAGFVPRATAIPTPEAA